MRGFWMTRAPYVPLWVTACAIAAGFTAVYGTGRGFPSWDLLALWLTAAAMTAFLLAAPPGLAYGWRGMAYGWNRGPPGPGDGTRPPDWPAPDDSFWSGPDGAEGYDVRPWGWPGPDDPG